MVNPNVGVIIPAWNEEKYIEKTLMNVFNQTITPFICVIDDGSTDNTYKIACKYADLIVKKKSKTYSIIGTGREAENWNSGIKELTKNFVLDYIMILGADQILETNYIEKVLRAMNEKIVIASGIIKGEPSRIPRGSGRIYTFNFLKEIGLFPLNYGFESYPLFKAVKMGLSYKVVKAFSYGQRKTKNSKNKLFLLGKGRRALGYKKITMFRDLVFNLNHVRDEVYLLAGYFSSDIERYENL